jgi:serine/threonine protein kinase
VFLTPTHLVLVLEYCPGGDLFHYVTARKGGLSEDEARWFFQQLMVAVDYCHRMVRGRVGSVWSFRQQQPSTAATKAPRRQNKQLPTCCHVPPLLPPRRA